MAFTSDLLLPGYWVDEETGAWCTLPWPTDPEEKMALVNSSLGPAIIDWSEGRTDEPGLIHPMSGEDWRWTPGQKRWLIMWYAVDPLGRFIYRSGVKRGSKGTGKDYVASGICNTELCGPVELYDFDKKGRPLGQPRNFPLVQVLSNSEAQSKDVLRVANAMWGRPAREYYGLDCGETRTIIKGTGGRFEIPPSAVASGEGDPATHIALNEALALDTPIPTPTGWTTMGELSVGDQVLSPKGEPVCVVKATETYSARTCYRVTFGDGDSIVADAGHLWAAQRIGDIRAKPVIVTTQQMVDNVSRYKIRSTAPMELPEAELPVDPYALGVWLGDGTRGDCAFSTQASDVAWWTEEFGRLGVPVRHRRDTDGGVELTFAGEYHAGIKGQGMRARLVDLGVYHSKQIPKVYLRASFKQRLALLQGLIDTDGCVDQNGRVIFVNTNQNLADGVTDLARSFGHTVHVSCRPDHRKDSYLPVYRVEWQGDASIPSARMPRKVDRLTVPTARQIASRWTRISSIEPVESVPVRCIAVDSDDHLFLAGQWKVTHNSQHMTDTSGGTRVAALGRRNAAKSPSDIQARLIEYTNAHAQGAGSVAEESFLAWQTQQTPNYGGRKDILYDSIEAPPGTDILTEQGRLDGITAAYADAPWIDKQRISDEMMDRRTSVADTIRFYLNGLGAEAESWIEPSKFDALADGGRVVADGDQIAMFLDCSKSSDATGLVACRLSDMFVFLPGGDSVWSRPHGWPKAKPWLVPREVVDAKVRAAFAQYEVVWFGVDPSPAKDDTDEHLYWMTAIDGWHRDFHTKLPVWATGGAKVGNSVLFDMRLSTFGAKQRNQVFTEAAEMVAKWIDDEGLMGPLRHDGNPMLRTHVHNARLRPNPWGTSLGKVTRDSSKLVDLAVCMVGAVMGARIMLNSGKLPKKRTGKATFV